MNSLIFNQPVILITGAGKGIGEALVHELINRGPNFQGLKLFLTSRTLSDLKKLQEKAKFNGFDCEILAQDLTANPAGLVDACVKRFGRIDALLHSAGVGVFGDFEAVTSKQVDFVIDTNVKATFLLLQKAYGQMKTQSTLSGMKGQIQVITSVAAERPFEHSSIYCMSKYAQRGLIEVMRGYGYKDQIRICEVRPGAVHTPMWGESATVELQPRMMKPQHIARSMVDALLLSPQASVETLTIRPMTGDL